MTILLRTVASLLSLSMCFASALAGPPEPIEYILDTNQGAIERSMLASPYQEKVDERGDDIRRNRWITGIHTASITLFATESEPTAACVVCPGGGYGGLAYDKEGTFVARWLSERGIAAGVLKYRIGKNLGKKPLVDAQRAVRFMQERTQQKVGVIGFSAGGHLAGWVSNAPNLANSEGSSGVAFSALIYPVITMDPAVTHGGSKKRLLGESPDSAAIEQRSVERLVTAQTPPTLLIHTMDDKTVPIENSLLFLRAGAKANVPVELHVYPQGGHGYGMWREQGTVANWPTVLEAWLLSIGVMQAK